MAPRAEKHTWGGKRGGGRPPSGRQTVQISFRLPPDIVAAFRGEVKRRQVTPSVLAAELLAAGLDGLTKQ